jgi:NADH:ubiquinone oxidoreductase subunit E
MEEILNDILQHKVKYEGNTISILQKVEESFGYLPEEALYWFSKKLNIPISTLYGIATFYNQFHLKKRGRNIITSCSGTACHVRGAKHIANRLREILAIAEGEDTSEDGEFTIDEVACIGACGISPVVIVNKKIHCQMSPEEVDDIINQLKKERMD